MPRRTPAEIITATDEQLTAARKKIEDRHDRELKKLTTRSRRLEAMKAKKGDAALVRLTKLEKQKEDIDKREIRTANKTETYVEKLERDLTLIEEKILEAYRRHGAELRDFDAKARAKRAAIAAKYGVAIPKQLRLIETPPAPAAIPEAPDFPTGRKAPRAVKQSNVDLPQVLRSSYKKRKQNAAPSVGPEWPGPHKAPRQPKLRRKNLDREIRESATRREYELEGRYYSAPGDTKDDYAINRKKFTAKMEARRKAKAEAETKERMAALAAQNALPKRGRGRPKKTA